MADGTTTGIDSPKPQQESNPTPESPNSEPRQEQKPPWKDQAGKWGEQLRSFFRQTPTPDLPTSLKKVAAGPTEYTPPPKDALPSIKFSVDSKDTTEQSSVDNGGEDTTQNPVNEADSPPEIILEGTIVPTKGKELEKYQPPIEDKKPIRVINIEGKLIDPPQDTNKAKSSGRRRSSPPPRPRQTQPRKPEPVQPQAAHTVASELPITAVLQTEPFVTENESTVPETETSPIPPEQVQSEIPTEEAKTETPEETTDEGEKLPDFTPEEKDLLQQTARVVEEAKDKGMSKDELRQFVDGLSLSPRLLAEIHKQIGDDEQPKPATADTTATETSAPETLTPEKLNEEATAAEKEATPNAPEKVKVRARVLRALYLALKYGLITAAGATIVVAGGGLLAMGAMTKLSQK